MHKKPHLLTRVTQANRKKKIEKKPIQAKFTYTILYHLFYKNY